MECSSDLPTFARLNNACVKFIKVILYLAEKCLCSKAFLNRNCSFTHGLLQLFCKMCVSFNSVIFILPY